jgi:RNA polymerase sigma-70 factor, ECF subfamily
MHTGGGQIASTRDDAKDLLAVHKTLQGDTNAFSEIVDRYTPVLYSLAFRLLGNDEEAEDAVQEILLNTFRSLKNFKIEARFYSWLYTIAVNWIRSRLRKRSRSGSARQISLDDNNPLQVPDDREQVEMHAITQCEENRAEDALNILKPTYKIVFVLRFIEEMSLKEIAGVLHMPIGTVKARIHRARKQLITELTSDNQGDKIE